MQMTIIHSPSLMHMAMMFNIRTNDMTDEDILDNFPNWVRKAESYDELKSQRDLCVNRIELSDDELQAKREGGDFLYSYLSQGYTCLGKFKGKPTPDMSHLGVSTVRRITKVGFYIDLT